MKNKFLLIFVLCYLLLFSTYKSFSQNPAYLNAKQDTTIDFVPDKETAIKIAIAVWLPIYGKDIKHEKPYVAILKEDGVWEVKGSLGKRWKFGGVAYAYIRKKDGKILKVIHTK